MLEFKLVGSLFLLFAWARGGRLVEANGPECAGRDCWTAPVPVCPQNAVFSEQEKGCVISEPLIRSCPEGFRAGVGAVQCSKNVHTEKILVCPENARYDKRSQACYLEKRESPHCRAGFIEDGSGECYRLKEAEVGCQAQLGEEERDDGCYVETQVKKEYTCREIPPSIRAARGHDQLSFTSTTAFLEGSPEYRDDGSPEPVCRVKVFHKPVCPEGTSEDDSGACVRRSVPEIRCPEGYLLVDESERGASSGLESRHRCQREDYVEPVSECPLGMKKEQDESGLETCVLVREEVPRQCPLGFVYVEAQRKCLRKEPATPRCNRGYLQKGGFCYLPEEPVLETSPVAYCSDPEAVAVGQYCIRNQSMAPNVDCPPGFAYRPESAQCVREVEVDPIPTCPPRFTLNPRSQACERKIEKDCSTVQYRKHCTGLGPEAGRAVPGAGEGEAVFPDPRSLNALQGHHHHHQRHGASHAQAAPPQEAPRIEVVHQCVEVPERTPKVCVNLESAPVVYVCQGGMQSSEPRKCVKKSSVSPSMGCPKDFKLRNGRCDQQLIEPVQYRCEVGFRLSRSPSRLPKCVPETEGGPSGEKKVKAFFECPAGLELSLSEFGQYECLETRSPGCASASCSSVVKIVSPSWTCPAGSEASDPGLPGAAGGSPGGEPGHHRRLFGSPPVHHGPGRHHPPVRSFPNIKEKPRCVVRTAVPIEKECPGEDSVLEGDSCVDLLEKTCPPGQGCEGHLEFSPALECPRETLPLGLHKADLCLETLKRPFRYHCLPGGKITQRNKCRYIEKKTCSHPDCVELVPVQGKMQCPPGYSETKTVSGFPGVPEAPPAAQANLLGLAAKRRLFGGVRPPSNIRQCAALEFAPFALSCPPGFAESQG
ncbi:oocyst wall protein 3, partial [Cryptosporidium felis]